MPRGALSLADAVVDVLPGIARPEALQALHEPTFAGNEARYLRACVEEGWVSSAGPAVAAFERELAEYTGVEHVTAVASGTAALHLCLWAAGVESGDEVLMPALTFVATANSAAYCGATPHFVDVDAATLGVDPARLEQHLGEIATLEPRGCVDRRSGRRIRALIAVHAFGHPPALDELARVCAIWRLALIEDAAEALGSRQRGRHAGSRGLASALSFNGNKIVTTGGGGAVLCGDGELAGRIRHVATTARLDHPWESTHDSVGFNYRLPALNAALGRAQLEQLSSFLRAKRRLAAAYREAFEPVAGASIFVEPEGAESNHWLNLLLLDRPDREVRDQILRRTHERGIATRPAWTLMHRLPMYRDCPRAPLPRSEEIEARLIALPSSSHVARGSP